MLTPPFSFNKAASGLCYICRSEPKVGWERKKLITFLSWIREWLMLSHLCLTLPLIFIIIIFGRRKRGVFLSSMVLLNSFSVGLPSPDPQSSLSTGLGQVLSVGWARRHSQVRELVLKRLQCRGFPPAVRSLPASSSLWWDLSSK